MTQNIHGVILLNKPQGITSNSALQQVKRLLGASKAGHTGSLDPLATGMLPICLGEATKFASYLLDEDKCYEVTGCLGIKTDTADSTGAVIEERDASDITVSDMLSILPDFQGTINQIPSMYSALKHQGKPLYAYARAGQTIERQARPVTIYRLLLVSMESTEFKLFVHCSKGTYIRNLVEDIGTRLGVGAHVTALHRPYTAGFCNHSMCSLEQLQEMTTEERQQQIMGINNLLPHIPPLALSSQAFHDICQGRYIHTEVLSSEITFVRLLDPYGMCFGIGEHLEDGRVKATRLMRLF